jgi:hypothetical protein
MSIHSRVHRGYATQRLAAAYLRRWWPYAEPVGAGRTGSDITGVPFDVEIKARAQIDLAALMRQLNDRTDGRRGIGLLRLNGQGPAQIDNWVAVLRFADLAELLATYHQAQPLSSPELPEGLEP